MGNAESTSRMIAMQADGVVQISPDAYARLRGDKRPRVLLGEGQLVIHEDDLNSDLERRQEQGYIIAKEKFETETEKLKSEQDTQLTQQAEERREAIAQIESKWKRLQETTEKEKETLRVQLEAEEKQKLSQLEARWKLILEEAKKDALSAQEAHIVELHTDQEFGELENKYKTLVEEQVKNEKTMLRLQLEQENNQKLEEAEANWKATLLETEERAQKEKEELQLQIEERVKGEAEALESQLGETLMDNLEEEKTMLRLQLEQESNQKLEEAEANWKATLLETEERAQKEKEELQLQIEGRDGEGGAETTESQWEETLRQKLEDVQNEKQLLVGQMEEEGRQKLEEVEAKWQQIFREATGKAVHINNADDAKAVIGEIEASWMSKLDDTEKVHGDIIKSIEDDHVNEKGLSDSKFVEQEKLVNDMLEKLQKLQSREEDVRQQFNTSVEKVENQLRPLQQKAVCVGLLDVVLNCYQENGQQALRCSEAVKKFMGCVDSERIALLKRNAEV